MKRQNKAQEKEERQKGKEKPGDGKKRKKEKDKWRGCLGGIIPTAWVSTGEMYDDDDDHTKASVC